MMTQARFLVRNLAVIFLLLAACHGVDSRDTVSANTIASNSLAFRSLRLGQTESPNSPVATTAAANNNEAVVVLNRTPGSVSVDSVLYLSASDDVARISYADGNLPSTAEAGGTKFSFSNFTAATVDVQVSSADGTTFAVTIPLDPTIQKLVQQFTEAGRASRVEPPEILRELYTRAIIGIKLFGCGTLSAYSAQGVQVPAGLSEISQSACTSLLVDLLRAFIAVGDFAASVIPGLAEDPACNVDLVAASFSSAEQCARNVGGELIDAILKIAPDITVAVQGTPTPAPTPASTPRPSGGGGGGSHNNNSSTPSLQCNDGRFRCADGGRTCNELACNGSADCADASDESNSLCTAEVLCCIASNGCPGESAGSCAPGCCCCSPGQKCSAKPYLHGCVDDNG